MKIAIAGGTGAVGRHVTKTVEQLGHEPVVLSRSAGVDLTTGKGLDAALQGVTAVIDVASTLTRSPDESKAFFTAVTRNLHTAEGKAGVTHHVALGIVGSDKAPFEYYAGKMVQEHLVEEGPTPWSILRATQFHEFATQIYGQVKIGPFHLIPTMVSQPVAAWQVAERLVDIALGEPQGRVTDLAGPEVLRMVDMVKQYVKATGKTGKLIQVPLPGGFGKAMRNGTLTPSGRFDKATQTYAQWLRQADLS